MRGSLLGMHWGSKKPERSPWKKKAEGGRKINRYARGKSKEKAMPALGMITTIRLKQLFSTRWKGGGGRFPARGNSTGIGR